MRAPAVPSVVLQLLPGGWSTAEVAAVRTGAMLVDIPIVNCTLDALVSTKRDHPACQAILAGAMAVGCVEFVLAALRLRHIEIAPWNCYPIELAGHLHRRVWRATVGDVCHGQWAGERVFVKPVKTKLFTGFVFDAGKAAPEDAAEMLALQGLPATESIWLVEVVEWASEHRYYIAPGADGLLQIQGRGRYDPQGDDMAPVPDPAVVNACVAALPFSHPCALDIGVLSTGETALVEINDAWGIGLYERAMSPRGYLSYLATRWVTLCNSFPSTNR